MEKKNNENVREIMEYKLYINNGRNYYRETWRISKNKNSSLFIKVYIYYDYSDGKCYFEDDRNLSRLDTSDIGFIYDRMKHVQENSKTIKSNIEDS